MSDKLSPRERTRVSRLGAKALHEEGLAYRMDSNKAREAINKRWAKYREEKAKKANESNES